MYVIEMGVFMGVLNWLNGLIFFISSLYDFFCYGNLYFCDVS